MTVGIRHRTARAGEAPPAGRGVVLCARGETAGDRAAAAVAVLLAAAWGATLRSVRPPAARPNPAGLADPVRVDAISRATRLFGADLVVLGTDAAQGRVASVAAALALGERRPVAVARRAPVRAPDGWVLAHVPREEPLARGVVAAGLACADALDLPVSAVGVVPAGTGGTWGKVALDGRAPALPEERAALARLARVLPEGEELERMHVQLRRGGGAAALVAAAREVRAELVAVSGDAETLLIDRLHERLLASGVPVVLLVPPPESPPARRAHGTRRVWRLAVGLGLAAGGLSALAERLA